MKVQADNAHLTYCTNIHPGESWPEVFANLRTHTRAVKQRISPDRPFGIGLRLSHRAALTLAEPETLADFAQWLGENGLYVFTINGFPYGPFHGQPVKEAVYRPDWLEEERLDYTNRLAIILAALLPKNMGTIEGSISTVPGCFRGRAEDPAGAQIAIAQRLIRQVATLAGIAKAGGPTIALALEPEPECLLETTAQLVDFFQDHIFTSAAQEKLATLVGIPVAEANALVRQHLGICLDACHAAVEFEDPQETIRLLQAAGIRILKLQISAGLALQAPNRQSLQALEPYTEGVYLHQTVIKKGDALTRHLDLPDALASARATADEDLGDEWRVHFHVPLFHQDIGNDHGARFHTTHTHLEEILAMQATAPFTAHLEIETYTWDVLPPALRNMPIADAIAREFQWTQTQLLPHKP